MDKQGEGSDRALQALKDISTDDLDAAIRAAALANLQFDKVVAELDFVVLVRAAPRAGEIISAICLALVVVALMGSLIFATSRASEDGSVYGMHIVGFIVVSIVLAALIVRKWRARDEPVVVFAQSLSYDDGVGFDPRVLTALLSMTRRVMVPSVSARVNDIEVVVSSVIGLMTNAENSEVTAVPFSICSNTFESDKRCRSAAETLDVTALRRPLVGGDSVLYRSVSNATWSLANAPELDGVVAPNRPV